MEKNIPLFEALKDISMRKTVPDGDEYRKKIIDAVSVLSSEVSPIRPPGTGGMPGGIINLKTEIPTVIVPDIHARAGLLLKILEYKPDNGDTIIEMLETSRVQIVCVGDGIHGEKRAFQRWRKAYTEFEGDYRKHSSMDDEMRESFGAMEIVCELKRAFPENFHFLKGNHENIKNEDGNGNYPFGKFVYEGAMVKAYVEEFYGADFINSYSAFEKKLPIFAIGSNFLISHSEPKIFYSREIITNYYDYPEVIYGLTWTPDDGAEEGSVQAMLNYYLSGKNLDDLYYFGGHRPIPGLYNLRAGGKYVQIHNPDKYIIAYIKQDGKINLKDDIIELKSI